MSILANRRSTMTLFTAADEPIGHSVRIVLAEKDINFDISYVDPDNPPEDLRDLNPYNSAITLVDRDLVLCDAQIIMEYLDERFPHPPLMPVDPVARANNRQLRVRLMVDLYGLIEDLQSDNDIAAANARKAFKDNLTAIAAVFARNEYFLSEEFSLLDCCLAPLLWRLRYYGIKLPLQAKPITQYGERVFSRLAFRTSLSPQEREIANP
ncbi:MAG: glutathione S-transferase N-terminal domain-containing protein [Gammaproteobacteria bacterium]